MGLYIPYFSWYLSLIDCMTDYSSITVWSVCGCFRTWLVIVWSWVEAETTAEAFRHFHSSQPSGGITRYYSARLWLLSPRGRQLWRRRSSGWREATTHTGQVVHTQRTRHYLKAMETLNLTILKDQPVAQEYCIKEIHALICSQTLRSFVVNGISYMAWKVLSGERL